MIAVALALANALSASSANVLGAAATRTAATSRVLFVSTLTALTAAALIALLFGPSASWSGLTSGFLAGTAGGIGLPLCYRAFAIGPVGIVSPVLASTATITVVVGAWTGSGRIAVTTAIGLVLCLTAVAIAGAERSREKTAPTAVLLALGAGLSFGAFSLLISRAPGTEGLWPLAAARLGVIAIALVLLGVTELRRAAGQLERSGSVGSWWLLAVLTGCCDILANVLFLLALVTGDLATISVVQALAPVAAVLIGWPILRQRPVPRHWIAVGVSVVALIVIALGSG